MFHCPVVCLFKNMKLLELRPTTAPTVLINMDLLCVSTVPLTVNVINLLLLLSPPALLCWTVKRRRNTHRHDYSDIDSGKKVCYTMYSLTFSSIVLSVLTIFLFCNNNRWCDFCFKESSFVFMSHASYADQHRTVFYILYVLTPLCSSVSELVVTACKL